MFGKLPEQVKHQLLLKALQIVFGKTTPPHQTPSGCLYQFLSVRIDLITGVTIF